MKSESATPPSTALRNFLRATCLPTTTPSSVTPKVRTVCVPCICNHCAASVSGIVVTSLITEHDGLAGTREQGQRLQRRECADFPAEPRVGGMQLTAEHRAQVLRRT